ncbi:MAG: hypothetical protein WCF84_20160 [Anaerolineae bacterium]
MRTLVLLVLVVSVLGLAACTGGGVTPSSIPPTLVPDTQAPTAAPTNTSAPIPTLAPPTAIATLVPATATRAPTLAPQAVPTFTPVGGAVTYLSVKLGIKFSYLPNQGPESIKIQETGDKVYVYPSTMAATAGQWVQVFSKTPNQLFLDAINTQVLKGYSLQDCVVKLVPNPNVGMPLPPSFVFAQITLPISENDSQEAIQAKAGKCPQPYAAIGGLAYFVADTQYPDKFAFFSIGQYPIMAASDKTWQTTFQFVTTGPTGATGGNSAYLDDRSTPQSLIQSYVNAINRQEYSRAFTYWGANAPGLAPFDQFVQGYANTASVQLTIGTINTGVGAGQIYSTVPVILTAQTKNNQAQTFVGCYVTHLAQPGNFGAPPIQPMTIQSAQVKQVANGANTTVLLATICQDSGYAPEGGPPSQPAFAANDISPARYLDDRSDAVQVLRSLFNAINRQEYVRAYSYWEPNAPQLAPFNQFQQGYANTASVQLTTGTVISSAGAGNFYYQTPVTLVAQTGNGVTQTFVGCYTLHLSNPGIQATPPFQPLALQSATVQQVANNANTTLLMGQACHP